MVLDFKLSRENASSGVIQVGVMSDAHDPSTFMPLADYNNDGRDRVLVPYKLLINTSHIADDSIYRYIAFRYGDVGSVTTSTSYWYWLDDVVVDTMPNCMKPEDLGLISYTENSATIKVWPYSNETNFSYVITSDMTKTNPDSVGATPVTVNSTTFTIDGLQPNTSYKIWVRTSCDGAVSEWYQDALTFHTLCNLTITIGYTENFDSITIGSIPECWVRLNVYGDNRPGVVEADAYDGIPTPAVKFEGAKSQILVMEKLNVPLNTLQLRFNLVKEGIGCGKFQVGVMSNPTDTSTFVPVATLDNGTMYNQKLLHEVDFVGVVDNTDNRYIAFRYGDVTIDTVTYTQALNYYYWIDDVELIALPNCLAVSDLNVTSVTTDSATIAFTTREGQTSWQYAISTRRDSVYPDATAVLGILSSNASAIGGLAPNTSYRIWVRNICDAGQFSSWSMYKDFRTDCSIVSIPYQETFTENNPNDFDNAYCWTRIVDNGTSNYSHSPYVSHYASDSHDAHGVYYYSLTTDNNLQMVASPEFASLANTELTFWLRKPYSYYGNATGVFEVGTMSNLDDTTTFVSLGNYEPATAGNWVLNEILLTNVPADHKYIVFKTRYVDGGYYSSTLNYYVDEVSVHAAPSCFKPDSLTYDINTVTATSVEISWQPRDGETNWKVFYKPTSATTWDSVAVSNSPTHTLTGLAPRTKYKVKVKTVCVDGVDESKFTDEIEVETLCAAEGLPFVETFDANVFLPSACWSMSNTKATNLFAGSESMALNPYGAWGRSTTVMTSGAAKLNIFGQYVNHWMITPVIEIPDTVENATLEFYASFNKYNRSEPATGTCDDDRFIVAIGTNGGNTWNQTDATVWSNDGLGDHVLNEIPSTPYRYSIDVSQYSGQAIRIGFYGESTIGDNGDNDIHIDSIVLKETIIIPAEVTTLPATDITDNSATLGKTVVQGTYPIESEGHYYRQQNSADPRFITASGDVITGLNPGTTYEHFAYAIANGISYYGDTLVFTTTGQASIPPVVTTLAATEVTQTTAKLHKTVVADQSEPVVSSGWKYSILGSNAWFEAPADSTLEGLQPDTTYEFYAYATTDINTIGYRGETLTFRTLAHVSPIVVTGLATDITSNTATLNKTVTAGSEDIIAEGWKYRVETSTVFSDVPADGQLTSLAPNTRYYYFAYATTATFTMVTGDTLSFTTDEPTGLELTECNVSIYPNPAKDEVNIAVDGLTNDATATIFDMQGKIVYKATVSATTGKTTVDVSTLTDGTYVVSIVSKDINRVERLIIKR